MSSRKIKLLLGREQPAAANGYVDYEAGRVWDEAGARERFASGILEGVSGAPRFLAAEQLEAFLAGLPPAVPVVLVFPPRHRTALPTRGSPAAQLQQACIDRFTALAAARPRTRVMPSGLPESSFVAKFPNVQITRGRISWIWSYR